MHIPKVAQPAGQLQCDCHLIGLASRALSGPLSAIQGSWPSPTATSYLQPYSHAFPYRTRRCNCNACLCAWQLMMWLCRTFLQHCTFFPPTPYKTTTAKIQSVADKICNIHIGLPRCAACSIDMAAEVQQSCLTVMQHSALWDEPQQSQCSSSAPFIFSRLTSTTYHHKALDGQSHCVSNRHKV
jgi:hypothetical protein